MSAVSVAEERKLLAIYDDVQSYSFKLASSALDKFQKKHPKSASAMALRMIFLERSDAGSAAVLKAYADMRKLGAGGELGGRAVWWAVMALRGIRRHDLTLELYQSLWAARPSSEEVGEQVFLAAAACWDTPVLVSSSRKMFNLQKTAVWARIAAWAEWAAAVDGAEPSNAFAPTAPAGALKTALVLLSTTKRAVPSSEALWLHAQIYLSAGQDDQALDLVRKEWEGSLARGWWRIQVVEEVSRRTRPAHAQEKGKAKESGSQNGAEDDRVSCEGALWIPEVEWIKAFLPEDQDAQRNYLYYRHLITAALATGEESHAQTAKQIFKELDDRIGKKERAPLLALLEINLRSAASTAEKTKTLFNAYIERFGSRGLFGSDCAGLLAHVDDAAKATIVDAVAAERDALAQKADRNQEAFLRLANAEIFLARHARSSDDLGEGEAKRIWALYEEGLPHGANLPKTDIQPADELGFLAVSHVLASAGSNDSASLDAVVMLRCMLDKSPSQKKAHFLLIRLYRLLGAPSLVAPSLAKLDPAEVQLDNLMHVVVDRGVDAVLGQVTAVLETYTDKAQLMYKRSATDLPDFVKQSLQNETYSKVQGIKNVARRLETSLSRASADVLAAQTEIMTSGSLSEESLDRLKRVDTAESFSDSRNWELLPDSLRSRGEGSVKAVTALGREVGQAWVKAWSTVLLAFGRVCAGEKVDQVPEVTGDETLLPIEMAVLRAFSELIKLATGSGGAEAGASLQSALSDLLEKTKSGCKSRWESLYGFTLLAMLSRMLDAAAKRTQEMAKPKKGQKTPQAVADAMAGLKAAREDLQSAVADLVTALEQHVQADEALTASDCPVGDAAFKARITKEVLEGRSTAVSNARRLLESGKK